MDGASAGESLGPKLGTSDGAPDEGQRAQGGGDGVRPDDDEIAADEAEDQCGPYFAGPTRDIAREAEATAV